MAKEDGGKEDWFLAKVLRCDGEKEGGDGEMAIVKFTAKFFGVSLTLPLSQRERGNFKTRSPMLYPEFAD
jgi:hypothetical protein